MRGGTNQGQVFVAQVSSLANSNLDLERLSNLLGLTAVYTVQARSDDHNKQSDDIKVTRAGLTRAGSMQLQDWVGTGLFERTACSSKTGTGLDSSSGLALRSLVTAPKINPQAAAQRCDCDICLLEEAWVLNSCPEMYPRNTIVQTHVTAPGKLNKAKRVHCIFSRPDKGPASIRRPKM